MTTGKRPSQVDITNSWQETIMVRVVSAEFGILDASDFSANRRKTIVATKSQGTRRLSPGRLASTLPWSSSLS